MMVGGCASLWAECKYARLHWKLLLHSKKSDYAATFKKGQRKTYGERGETGQEKYMFSGHWSGSTWHGHVLWHPREGEYYYFI